MRRLLSALLIAGIIVCGVLGGVSHKVPTFADYEVVSGGEAIKIDRFVGLSSVDQIPDFGSKPQSLAKSGFIDPQHVEARNNDSWPISRMAAEHSRLILSVREHVGINPIDLSRAKHVERFVDVFFHILVKDEASKIPQIKGRSLTHVPQDNIGREPGLSYAVGKGSSELVRPFDLDFDPWPQGGLAVYEGNLVGILSGQRGLLSFLPSFPDQSNANQAEEYPGYSSLSHSLSPFRHFPLSFQILAIIVGLGAGGAIQVICWRRSNPGTAYGWAWLVTGIIGGALGCLPLLAYLG